MNEQYLEAVKVIKTAILKSQSRAIQYTNKESLGLYYSIGGIFKFRPRWPCPANR